MRLAPALVPLMLLAGCLTAPPEVDDPPLVTRPADPATTPSAGAHAPAVAPLVDEPYYEGDGGSETCNGLGSWDEPGLFAALAGRAETRRVRPEPHIPFDADAAGLPEPARMLRRLAEEVGRDSLFVFQDEARTKLAGMLEPERTKEEIAPRFDAFARKLLDADDAERARLFDAFWASREPGLLAARSDTGEVTVESYSFAVDVDAPRPERVVRELEEQGTGAREQVGGSVHVRWDVDGARWVAELDFAERRARLAADGGALVLYASEADRASAYGPEGLADERAFIRATMERHGLPAPTFEGWVEDLAVC